MNFFDQDRLYFLLKDPHWTFVWWQITPETIANAREQAGDDAVFTLRVLEVREAEDPDHPSRHTFDIEVRGLTDHWYLFIPQANRDYCVEAGLTDRAGGFFPLIRSNTLQLPPDCPSDEEWEQWSTLQM